MEKSEKANEGTEIEIQEIKKPQLLKKSSSQKKLDGYFPISEKKSVTKSKLKRDNSKSPAPGSSSLMNSLKKNKLE